MTNTHTHTLLTPTQQWNISFRQQSAAGVGLCEGVRGATRIPGCHPTGSDSDEEFRFPTFTPKLFFLILLPPWVVFLFNYYYFANWRVRTLSADSCWYTKLFIYKEIRKKNWQLAFWTASIHPAGWLIHRPINRDCFLFLWWSIFDCLTWFFSPLFCTHALRAILTWIFSIILESSYSLYDRAFADNIGTVLFYAVIVSVVFSRILFSYRPR